MARRLNIDGDGQGDLAGHDGERRKPDKDKNKAKLEKDKDSKKDVE
jgi:hypothetical protein